MAEQDDLPKRLVRSLGEDPTYVLHGELETSAWGSGQWIEYTDGEGREHYLRVTVEP